MYVQISPFAVTPVYSDNQQSGCSDASGKSHLPKKSHCKQRYLVTVTVLRDPEVVTVSGDVCIGNQPINFVSH